MQRADFDIDRFTEACKAVFPDLADAFQVLGAEESEGVVSQLRYAGYIDRQQREAARQADEENVRIPEDMSYRVPGLSNEIVEKLSFVRPVSLGQASRIPGVTPAAISIVRMHLRRGARIA
jgi:tRNA uridine 5-carboxymethylaminomethyl modification enzyme